MVDVTKHPHPVPAMTWEMLYVALTRCRQPQDLRIFGSGSERFVHLKVNPHHVAWFAGFTGTSTKWNVDLALDKLRALRNAAPPKK
jgi:hypothetical protein